MRELSESLAHVKLPLCQRLSALSYAPTKDTCLFGQPVCSAVECMELGHIFCTRSGAQSKRKAVGVGTPTARQMDALCVATYCATHSHECGTTHQQRSSYQKKLPAAQVFAWATEGIFATIRCSCAMTGGLKLCGSSVSAHGRQSFTSIPSDQAQPEPDWHRIVPVRWLRQQWQK